MFPRNYFAASYFAPVYYPVGGAVPTQPAAVSAFFLALPQGLGLTALPQGGGFLAAGG